MKTGAVVGRLLVVACVVGTSSGLVSCGASTQPETSKTKVIYGEDDRKDLFEVKDPQMIAVANATVGIVSTSDVLPDPENSQMSRILVSAYSQANMLCKDEKFYEQVTAPWCSGSLVGPDLIMTAGHCITSQHDCDTSSFVFDFALKSKNDSLGRVENKNIYKCAEIVGRKAPSDNSRETDWAIIRLDRRVTDRKPLVINRANDLKKGTHLYVVGHPAGLPMKVSNGASVRTIAANSPYFIANLDSYGGNSGSPVVNQSTGLVEGILVRGETDFEWDTSRKCRASKKCTNEGCRGEDVTKVSEVARLIPALSP